MIESTATQTDTSNQDDEASLLMTDPTEDNLGFTTRQLYSLIGLTDNLPAALEAAFTSIQSTCWIDVPVGEAVEEDDLEFDYELYSQKLEIWAYLMMIDMHFLAHAYFQKVFSSCKNVETGMMVPYQKGNNAHKLLAYYLFTDDEAIPKAMLENWNDWDMDEFFAAYNQMPEHMRKVVEPMVEYATRKVYEPLSDQ